jgi:uncharacterized membrane protein YbhN (UPF0104 family)
VIEQLRRRVLIGLALGILVVGVIFVLADGSALLDAFEQFDWRLAAPVLLLVMLNYVLRFLKWQYYLRLSNVEGLSRRMSALIFLSGFSMAMTPGKVGEFLKSYFVRRARYRCRRHSRAGGDWTARLPLGLAGLPGNCRSDGARARSAAARGAGRTLAQPARTLRVHRP